MVEYDVFNNRALRGIDISDMKSFSKGMDIGLRLGAAMGPEALTLPLPLPILPINPLPANAGSDRQTKIQDDENVYSDSRSHTTSGSSDDSDPEDEGYRFWSANAKGSVRPP
jgi:hypothetical protein